MDKQRTKRAKKKRSGDKSIKFRCDYSSTPLKVLESRGWTRIYDAKDRGWDLWWCDCSEIKLALDNLQRLRGHQRVAHFLNHGELTRKNLLYRNLRRYKRLLLKAGKSREAELCDIMPVSFELPSEYRMLVEEYRKCQGTTWIVKPAAGSQGRGIFLFQRLRDLAEWRSKEYPAPSADSNSDCELLVPPDIYIVQKYIDDPYLLGGCKFDLRIYVLVTCFQPLKVWLAREGFARLSGEQFSLERIDDSRVHLTNMSIQLKATAGASCAKQSSQRNDKPPQQQQPDYERTSPPVKLGSKWPLNCLRQYLTERHGSAVVDDLLHNIAAGHIEETLALESIGESANEENELRATSGKGMQVAAEGPAKVKRVEKSLRIGWLNKAAGGTKYRKVAKPRGGVKKLKLDASACYSACQIRSLAIEVFEASSGGDKRVAADNNYCAIEEEYAVDLGDFGGQVISDFRRRDGQVCDIWEYCRDRGKRLYQLNLFLLTSPIDEWGQGESGHKGGGGPARTISTRRTRARPSALANELRVLYQYVRTSRYSSELSYTECEKPELHARLFEDQCGDCPTIEHFEPSDHGYSISRIVKGARVLLQISVDDEGAKAVEFGPEAKALEEQQQQQQQQQHAVLHDLDELQGYCNWKYGIGFVPSCAYACRPVFSWYKDGQLFKRHEYLYWLDDVRDREPHLWSCTVSCTATGRQLKSKEITVDGF